MFLGLQSSEFAILYYQAIMLTRTKPGAQATVSFTNPGGASQSATLTAVSEVNSLLKELNANQTPDLLPVDLQTLTVNGTDIGYIKVNTNADDLNLELKLFERGLKDFQQNKVAGLIIDLRDNGGGVPLGLAGFLTNQTINLGQLEYYNSLTGKFEPQDQPDQILPNQDQYQLINLTFSSVSIAIAPVSLKLTDSAKFPARSWLENIRRRVSKRKFRAVRS